MSQCVPNWDIAEAPMDARPDSRSYHGLVINDDAAMLDYEIAELTWENGQLGMHGFGPPRFQMKHSGTLESIVNPKTDTDYVPWYAVSAPTPTPIMDALVPSSKANALHNHTDGREGSSKGSVPTCDTDFTPATSHDSPENKQTSFDDHDSVCHHGTPQKEAAVEKTRKKGKLKSSISVKKNRAAVIHNQSERKRRDKINQRMKTLQKLVPNSNKTDKASMLDEVIEYLKQLQAQVHLMNQLNIPSMNMMLPMTMQQQQQFPMTSFMAPMGLGMGMGMGMGMGLGMDHLNMVPPRPGLNAAISPLLHPSAFMPITPWDGATCDQLQASSAAAMMVDPLSTFLACQSQPMTMEMYNRMAALFQHLHQHRASAGRSKN